MTVNTLLKLTCLLSLEAGEVALAAQQLPETAVLLEGHTSIWQSKPPVAPQRPQPENTPQQESQQTLHIFDEPAGPDCYEIKRVVGGEN
jgi:hypothetical protein